MARTSSLTPAVTEKVCEALKLGVSFAAAAATPIATWPERAAQFASAVRLALNLTTVGV